MNKSAVFAPALALATLTSSAQSGTVTYRGIAGEEGKRYNVVFILIDQLSALALPLYGNDNIKTPNIDRLAKEGVTFVNSVCVTPFSSPARASLVTGLYPVTHGVIVNQFDPEEFPFSKPAVPKVVAGLDPTTVTTEGTLYDCGYQTKIYGKWHLGWLNTFKYYENSSVEVYQYDFLQRYIPMREAMRRTPALPRKGEVLRNPDYDQGFGLYQTRYIDGKYQAAPEDIKAAVGSFGRQGTPMEFTDWGLMGLEAVKYFEGKKNGLPFMVTISLEPPHPDFIAPDPYYSKVNPSKIKLSPTADEVPTFYKNSRNYRIGQYLGREGTQEKMRCYYAQTLFIDDMVGRILKAIDRSGLKENTLVVFTSDHGDPLSSHGMLYDKGIDGFVEELIRTPMILRLPKVIPAGKKYVSHFNSIDLAPTILDYVTGFVPPEMQGRSLKPVIEGKEKDETGFAFITRPEARAVRGELDGKIWFYSKVFNLRTKTSREELYCITNDPWQQRELSKDASCKEILLRMKARHDEYAARYGDQSIENLPEKGLTNYGNWKQ